MQGDPGWLYIPVYDESDYFDAIEELRSIEEMLADVETYDDWFVDG